MHDTTLFVPGFHGSGANHWQTWLEERLPGARRVSGIDWESPVLARWARAVGDEIARSPDPVWIVAHSFGCLASIVAATVLPDQVTGLILVAPADPEQFSPLGPRNHAGGSRGEGIIHWLPHGPLEIPSVIVASSNDPWLRLEAAKAWADRWGSTLVNLGNAGHINVDSGFGPWPFGLALVRTLQGVARAYPPGSIRIERAPINTLHPN